MSVTTPGYSQRPPGLPHLFFPSVITRLSQPSLDTVSGTVSVGHRGGRGGRLKTGRACYSFLSPSGPFSFKGEQIQWEGIHGPELCVLRTR